MPCRVAVAPSLGNAIGGAYGGYMTRTDGTSDADIEAMCTKLLANTVIENFKIERL